MGLINIPDWVDFINITGSKEIKGYTVDPKLKTMNIGKISTKQLVVLPHVIKLPDLFKIFPRYLDTEVLKITTHEGQSYKEFQIEYLLKGGL